MEHTELSICPETEILREQVARISQRECQFDKMEKQVDAIPTKVDSTDRPSVSHISVAPVGRENLGDALAPHASYEGRHRYDPGATWTKEEERSVVRKTDLYLLSWICVMV